jgi:hypothetical protein
MRFRSLQNRLIKPKRVEKLLLIVLEPPHHPRLPHESRQGNGLTLAATFNRLLQQNLPTAAT